MNFPRALWLTGLTVSYIMLLAGGLLIAAIVMALGPDHE